MSAPNVAAPLANVDHVLRIRPPLPENSSPRPRQEDYDNNDDNRVPGGDDQEDDNDNERQERAQYDREMAHAQMASGTPLHPEAIGDMAEPTTLLPVVDIDEPPPKKRRKKIRRHKRRRQQQQQQEDEEDEDVGDQQEEEEGGQVQGGEDQDQDQEMMTPPDDDDEKFVRDLLERRRLASYLNDPKFREAPWNFTEVFDEQTDPRILRGTARMVEDAEMRDYVVAAGKGALQTVVTLGENGILALRPYSSSFNLIDGWSKEVYRETQTTRKYDTVVWRCFRSLFPEGSAIENPFLQLGAMLGLSAFQYGAANAMKQEILAEARKAEEEFVRAQHREELTALLQMNEEEKRQWLYENAPEVLTQLDVQKSRQEEEVEQGGGGEDVPLRTDDTGPQWPRPAPNQKNAPAPPPDLNLREIDGRRKIVDAPPPYNPRDIFDGVHPPPPGLAAPPEGERIIAPTDSRQQQPPGSSQPQLPDMDQMSAVSDREEIIDELLRQ